MLLYSVNYYTVICMPSLLLAKPLQVFSGINLKQNTPILQLKKAETENKQA